MNEAFEKWWAKSLATLTRPEHVTADSKHWALLAFEAATPQWQSISLAPKDGTDIIGLDAGIDTISSTRWCTMFQYWDYPLHFTQGEDEVGCNEWYPTHFQPRPPEPPKQ